MCFMKNKKMILSSLLVTILLINAFLFKDIIKKEQGDYKDTDINIVLSLEDKITKNSMWCGTFNLIWNDLKNELAHQDIVFSPQLEIVENLNKGTFNNSYLSDNSYYKKLGIIKPELKAEIKTAIKDKFNENSAILDDFDFTYNGDKNYFLYAMLIKEFKFPYVFSKLDNDKFKNIKNVKYFGINSETDKKVYNQVEVLYYDNEDSFAVKLNTKENEEIILSRGFKGNSFNEIYDFINAKNKEFNGSKTFDSHDYLKIPNIDFKIKEEFKELEKKDFLFANQDTYYIDKAIQTIEFKLDHEGGKLKSEAGMSVNETSAAISSKRYFYFNDDFVIILKEKDKNLPYFAAYISDIKSVQNIA